MQNRNLNIEVLEPLLLMSASGIEVDLVSSDGNDYLVATEADGFLDGGDGDDILEGRGGSNFLSGGAGDDTLFSIKGDNVLNGGAGNDVAVYTGNRADYEVEDQGFGIFAVRSSDRTDFVTEVETLRFDDGEFNIGDLVGATASGQTSDVQAVEPAQLAPEPVIEIEPVLDPSVASGPAVPDTAPVIEATTVLAEPLSIAAPDPVAFEYIAGDDGDNTIEGNANNNFIDAGAGDDVVIGAGGDDILNGQDGNDTIYGDDGNGKVFTGETVRETFQWDLAGVGNDKDLNSFTQDTGNVSVKFTVLQETGKAETEFSSDKQNIYGLAVDATSSMDSELKGKGNQADYALEFSDAVNDVSFRINDIDGDGVVRVTAYDANNNPINVDLTGGSKVTLSDTDGVTGNDTADSKGGYLEDDNAAHSVLVKIAGPVSRLVIEHDQDGHQNSGINVTDITYDAPVFAASTGDTDGNDVINGGAGDDLLVGQGGDDAIDGGDGNDVIYGDEGNGNGTAGETVRESLEWDLAGVGNDKALSNFTQNTGNVDVTFTVLQQTGAAETEFSSDQQKVHGIDADGNPVDAKSSLDSELKGKGNQADYALDFSAAVEDVSFRINDIDGDGVVRVTAYDANNNPINVNLSGGSKLTLSNTDSVAGNDTADSKGGYQEDDSPAYSVLVDIAGPVSRIVIEHDQNGHQNSGINITDVYFDAPVAGSLTTAAGGGVGGDDLLNGGAGDDLIVGQGGNDTINGGAGDDIIYGDEGDTSVLGNDGGNNSGGTGSLKILGTNGAYNGSVVMQVLDGATGAVKNTVELTNNYDANVGSQFALNLGSNDVVRVGITSPEGTFYSDTANSTASMNADGSVRLSFEDIAGLGDRDFDDVIVEVNLGGSSAKLLTSSGTFGGVTVAEGLKGTGPNLIVNGSFEDTTGTTATGYGFVGKGAIAGWTDANGSNIDLHNDGRFGIQATDGNNWLDMDASPANNVVGQNVAGLAVGETYRLSFDLGDAATAADNTSADNTVTVMWGGEAIATINPVDGVMNSHSFDLVAGAGDGSDRLEFVGGGKADYYGASVDNVQLFATEPVGGGTENGNGNAGGDDLLTGGEGADKIYGGGGSDTIIGGNDGDFVDGGTEGTDYDVLDLRGVGPFQVVNETIDADGDSTSGTIEFLDGLGNVTGSLGFTEIEEIRMDEAPVTVNDSATTPEDTPVTIDVLDNDSDPNGQTLKISDASVPADQGTVDIVDGKLVFTPAPNFNGDADITYVAEDPDGNQTPGTLTVTVEAAPNKGPIAGDDALTTPYNTVAYGSVTNNDTDPEGDTLTYSLTADASNGTLSFNDDGTYSYSPDSGFVGQDTFTYSVSDGNGGTAEATVTVTVEPELIIDPGPVDPGPEPNDEPIAVDDSGVTTEDVKAYGSVAGNDSDPDGDTLTYSLVTGPGNGQVTMYADGSYEYLPESGFVGQDSFTYQVDDGNGGTATATVTMNVDPKPIVDPAPIDPGPVDPAPQPNQLPDAVDDNFSTTENVKAYGTVAGNDSDSDGDPLTYSLMTGPSNGMVTLYADGSYEYSPDADFVGEDSFNYLVHDGKGGTDVATVTMTVTPEAVEPGPVDPTPLPEPNQGPIAVDDVVMTTEGESAYGTIASNDSDPDGDTLTYSLTTGSANGVVTLYADGSYEYLPEAGFVGQDSFTYQVEDGSGGTDTATVTITVAESVVNPEPVDPGPINQNPDAIKDYNTTDMDTAVNGRVLCNDVDPDGDALSATLKTPPQNGTVTVRPNGSYTYTPNSGFSGTDTFVYEVSDGNGGTDTAEVSIEVGCAPNSGPDAVDDVVATQQDSEVSGSVAGNDSDADGDRLAFYVDEGPAHGSLVFNTDGTYVYTPDPGFSGSDSFTYEATDGNGGSDIATVMVTVDPVSNQGPDAVQDFNSTTYNTAVSGKVLCNDTDPEGDALAVKMNTQPANGTVTITPGGSYTYTPNNGFSGQDTFTYTITDGNGGCDTATVTIEVGEPLVGGESIVRNTIDATDDSFSTDYDTEVSGNVLVNDVDPDGDSLTATEMTDVRTSDGGTVSLFADGSFNYTPATGFTGVDTFVYESSDGNGNVTTATVRITVNEASMAAVDDGFTGETNDTISGSVVINDIGVDSDVSVAVVEGPANGTLTLNSDGTFTYLANDGFSGEDTFRYTLVDGATTSEANVRLVIAEVNYDTTYVGSGQDGLIWGDPHFRGDDGGFYDVTGEAGSVYNLLSDSNLQLNARFIHWQGEVADGTVIGEIGLTLGDDKLHIDLDGATLNGADLATGQTAMGPGSVSYDGTVARINTGDYLLQLIRQDGLFAVRISVIDPFSDLVAPHGLWGQTVDADSDARDGDYYKDNYIYGLQGGGALDTVDADGNIVRSERGDMSSYSLYETADLFSTTALSSAGDDFFRFDARQGTGLNRL